MRAGRAMERPLHTPTLQRALRHWRRDVTSQRELRDQRDAWRVAVTVLGAARTLDRQQGALCRLAVWCRSQQARASTLVAASKRLALIRARHATRRWQAAAQLAALGASARLRLGDHAALARARAGLRGLEAAAGRARRRDAEVAAARAIAARAGGARLLRRLRERVVRGRATTAALVARQHAVQRAALARWASATTSCRVSVGCGPARSSP